MLAGAGGSTSKADLILLCNGASQAGQTTAIWQPTARTVSLQRPSTGQYFTAAAAAAAAVDDGARARAVIRREYTLPAW